MRVKGVHIPDGVVAAGLARIQSGEPFVASDIQAAMTLAGDPAVDYCRAADALLQKERIGKRIEFIGGRARSTGYWQIRKGTQ